MASHDIKDEQWARVEQSLPNRQFRVHIEGDPDEKLRLAYLGGKLAKHFIKILIGDRVKVYCPSKDGICRVTYRPKTMQ